jgi:hypothetical protein
MSSFKLYSNHMQIKVYLLIQKFIQTQYDFHTDQWHNSRTSTSILVRLKMTQEKGQNL